MKKFANIALPRRFLALVLLLVASQLALLAHQVVVDHDQAVDCEICQIARQAKWHAPSAEVSLAFVALVVVITAALTESPFSAETRPGYLSRAPPRH